MYHIPYKKLFSSLGEYINALPCSDEISTTELMNIVCKDVFDDVDKVDEMEVAYNSYFPDASSDGKYKFIFGFCGARLMRKRASWRLK